MPRIFFFDFFNQYLDSIFSLFEFSSTDLSFALRASEETRILIWKASFEFLSREWLFGTSFLGPWAISFNGEFGSAHNDLLDRAVRLGVPANCFCVFVYLDVNHSYYYVQANRGGFNRFMCFWFVS